MVTIIGGGLVGPVAAKLLSDAGLEVMLIDAKPLPVDHDGRAISISYGSKMILEKAGMWDDRLPAEPIWEIRVFENGSAWTVDFEGEDHPLGFILEYSKLRTTMLEALDNIRCLWGTSVCTLSTNDSSAQLTLSSGESLTSSLIIGAEGRHSITRQVSSIRTTTKDYGDVALVGTVFHEKPHNNTAWEVFLQQGMLALLPMPMCGGCHRSGFVFFQDKGTNFEDFENLSQTLENYFPYYGALEVQKDRWCYPVISLQTDRLIDKRLALVGDAAHVLHPIAGQGANLGWQDADILCAELIQAFSLGLDVGSDMVLKAYAQKRQCDHQLLQWSTSGLRHLFRLKGAHFVRNAGFALVNKMPGLKKWIAKKAMGI